MKKLIHPIYIFGIVFLVFVAGGCNRSTKYKLEKASVMVKEHPDSAYLLLKEIDYYKLDPDSLKAKFILTKALTNVRLGRSLITDTLLNQAASYYLSVGDTINWVMASRLLSGYDYYRGDVEESKQRLEEIKSKVKNPDLLWDIYKNLLEISLNTEAYSDAYGYADWLLRHTDREEQILKFVVAKAASQYYLAGSSGRAVELMDSVIKVGTLEKANKEISDEFYLEYAEMLAANGDAKKSIEIIFRIFPDDSQLNSEKRLIKNVSLAQYYANLGDTGQANMWLEKINQDGTREYLETYSYIAMLKAALQYKETGRFPAELMHKVSKNIDLKHRMTQYDRETALESMMELSEDNYRLIIERQRLWLSLSIISLVLVVGAVAVYIVYNRRKRKLVAAEERIEALNEMLSEVRNSKEDDNSSALKKLALQQMGIFRVFASTPGETSREALKKISGIGDKGFGVEKLMDWDNLYTMIDQLYDNFHSRLIEEYPDLFSQKEIQIICLMKADFTTKEIAFITEQSTATVYVRKSSIRKKLEAPENSDILTEIGKKCK